jgi:hypothetical protein
MTYTKLSSACIVLGLLVGTACKDGGPTDEGPTETETGDGDPSTGDGDPSTGDGDPTTGDGDPTTGDGDPTDDPTPPGHGDGDAAEHATVYELRNGAVPLGGWVWVSNVWVTAKHDRGLWVQEQDGGPYSGIWVYVGEYGPNIESIQVGDVVDVIGVSGVFTEITEINALNGEILPVGTLDSLPQPATITPTELGAEWESVLVRVEGDPLTVVSTQDFHEFVVDDGVAAVRVDDFLYDLLDAGAAEFPNFGVGATFTAIQGPLNLSSSTYTLAPRSVADLEGYQGAP